ncbi:serine/arginine repetitive matrix protein 2 [Streptomyces sp. NPDC048357]|uniref:serine/arginine repetitive matrix protein 2 n=1 Tax=Streptomyces sp. NPDC048357 TaxID=3154719 RepID=UPI0034161BE3
MAPAQPPSGPRRWDAQAQRWVVDQAPAGQPSGLPPVPPQPSGAPPYDPLGPGAPAPPPYGAPTAPQPPYGSDPGYPPPVPPQPGHLPPSGGPRGRWRTPVTAGIAVASVAIGAGAVWFLARDTDDANREGKNGTVASGTPSWSGGEPSGTGSPTASGSPTGGTGPSPSPSPTGTGPGAGAGAHETKQDPAGFTIAVPAGWVREELKEGVFYRSADRTALIQVFRVSEPELSPLEAVTQASGYLRSATRGYQEVRVGPVPGGSGAAELVYQYDSDESHGLRRGVERVLFASDGGKWAVLTAGPAAEWQVTQEHHAAALAAFRPTG